MRDLLLFCSGFVVFVFVLFFGLLGVFLVFVCVCFVLLCLCLLFWLVWLDGTVAWIGGGVLLLAAPWMDSNSARHWIVVTFAVVFGFAALGNAFATRGRHFGWVGMGAVVALAVAGY